MSNIHSIAIQTIALQKESLLEEDSRLTDDLRKKIPSKSSSNAPVLQVLEAAVSVDDAFDSLYQLLQYLKSSLKAAYGSQAKINFVQVDDETDGKEDDAASTNTITLQHDDAIVEIAYRTVQDDASKASLDPAERNITISSIQGQAVERVDAPKRPKRTKTLTSSINVRSSPRKTTQASSSSSKRKAEQEKIYNDGEEEEEGEDDSGSLSSNKRNQKWLAMCDRLRKFKEERGHSNVPKDYIPDRPLGSWVASQRTAYKEGRLTQDRIDALEALDFVWSFRTIGKPEDLKEQADDVDWDAPATERKWRAMLDRLKQYKAEKGDTRVPSGYKPDPQLAYWVQNQRVLYKKGKLPQERIDALNEVEFIWKVYKEDGSSPGLNRRSSKNDTDEKFNEMLERLKKFKEEFGHCVVQTRYERDLELGKWVKNQRQLEKDGKLKEERKAALDAIGFDWKVGSNGDRSWEDNFQRLLEFKEKWGDCLVPTKYEPDQRLASWVMWQRGKYHQNKLPDEYIRKLDDVGFVWKVQRKGRRINHVSDVRGGYKNSDGFVVWSPSTSNEFWQAQLEKLKAYKAKFGHTNVPVVYFQDLQLAKWVTAQRMMYTKGQLSQDRIDQLEDLGFVWRLVRSWDDNFERLQEYHTLHGNCDVPVDYEEDPKLGRWVKQQRAFSKRKELTQERLDKLRSLGFTWNPPKGATKLEPAEDFAPQLPTPKDSKTTSTGPLKTTPASGVLLPADKAARLRATNARLSEDRRNLEAENRELRRKLKEAEEANAWEDGYEQLKDYVAADGDANVPVVGSRLGQWVAKQRDQYKREVLSKERIAKLESIGFEWVRKRGRPGSQPDSVKADDNNPPPPPKKQRIINDELLAEEAKLEREKEVLAEAKRKLEEEKEKLRLRRESLQAAKAKQIST